MFSDIPPDPQWPRKGKPRSPNSSLGSKQRPMLSPLPPLRHRPLEQRFSLPQDIHRTLTPLPPSCNHTPLLPSNAAPALPSACQWAWRSGLFTLVIKNERWASHGYGMHSSMKGISSTTWTIGYITDDVPFNTQISQ